MAYKLTYLNQGATRNLPVSDRLAAIYQAAAEKAGIDEVRVISGGQSGERRTGSHRHDEGGAGDIKLVKNGRVLSFENPDDRPLVSSFISATRGGGATGIGAGTDYMGPETIHVGFGNEAVWGAGGKGANAPEWLRAAFGSPKGVSLASSPEMSSAAASEVSSPLAAAPLSAEGAAATGSAPSNPASGIVGALGKILGGISPKQAEPEQPMQSSLPTTFAQDAGRQQAAANLMSTLLAGKKRRGLSLDSLPMMG